MEEKLVETIAAGAALVGFNAGITQKVKGAFEKVDPEVCSIVVGVVTGPLAYIFTQGVPSDVESGVGMAIFCIAAALVPSGGFELVKEFVGKPE